MRSQLLSSPWISAGKMDITHIAGSVRELNRLGLDAEILKGREPRPVDVTRSIGRRAEIAICSTGETGGETTPKRDLRRNVDTVASIV
jgi:hypothetical protein